MSDSRGFLTPGGAAGFLDRALDSADDAILAKDPQRDDPYWNAAAERSMATGSRHRRPVGEPARPTRAQGGARADPRDRRAGRADRALRDDAGSPRTAAPIDVSLIVRADAGCGLAPSSAHRASPGTRRSLALRGREPACGAPRGRQPAGPRDRARTGRPRDGDPGPRLAGARGPGGGPAHRPVGRCRPPSDATRRRGRSPAPGAQRRTGADARALDLNQTDRGVDPAPRRGRRTVDDDRPRARPADPRRRGRSRSAGPRPGGPRRRFEGPVAVRRPDHDRHATRQGRLRCQPTWCSPCTTTEPRSRPTSSIRSSSRSISATRAGDGNLWLATAHGILAQSGGSMRATSGPDGTTFTVRLPAAGHGRCRRGTADGRAAAARIGVDPRRRRRGRRPRLHRSRPEPARLSRHGRRQRRGGTREGRAGTSPSRSTC